MKISKLKNDTINNLLYLYCKQQSVYGLSTTLFQELDDIDYSAESLIEEFKVFFQKLDISPERRINIMFHTNQNKEYQKHEDDILIQRFDAFKEFIKVIGEHIHEAKTNLF